ncbi:hypothetical protein Q8A67_024871 [Cirrhinus molitorella]|uniref:Uncharacterized protein n=1 Tax=Cirrhinus molitorella TaxID=172907 RepID=A0AA88P6Q6_9TELE|nr:hypothetical protein Q8A67_024871 [Cirrhinus molitorella]
MNTLWLPLLLSSVIWAEEQYFPQSPNATWDEARLYCQSCFKELTTITSRNIHLIVNNLSVDYWVGLRKSYNGSFPWAAWSNGDPVTYQNWYPGHPVPNKEKKLIPICSSTTQSPLTTPMSTPMSTLKQTTTVASAPMTSTISQNFTSNDTCPILADMLLCLNMTCYDLESAMSVCMGTPPVTHNTTTYSPTPETTTFSTTFTATTHGTTTDSTTASNCIFEPEPDPEQYIEDACVVLLSFGMWKEENCNKSLPFVCYDERFFGQIYVSDVNTSAANVSWTEGPGAENISHYRVEITKGKNQTFNLTFYQTFNQTDLFEHIQDLTAGTLYTVQVFPVKCGRDLNPQNISFYTKPSDVQNLTVVKIEKDFAILSWTEPEGNYHFYSIHVKCKSNDSFADKDQKCQSENCTIVNLIPGYEYEFTVKAVVNETIGGVPSNISDYTKPSTVMNLQQSKEKYSTFINASWDAPEGGHSGYRYCLKKVDHKFKCDNCNIITNSSITVSDSNSTANYNITDCTEQKARTIFIDVGNKSDGTEFCLCVAALTKNGNLSGDPVAIPAYTSPKKVILNLSPDYQSMNASWEIQGKYERFNVSIITDAYAYNKSADTKELNYIFTDLKAGVYYTVSVVTVTGDLTSDAATCSDYTRPAKPDWVKSTVHKTTIELSWGAPNSSGDAVINYNVKYNTTFWNTSTEINTNKTKLSIPNLRPGTRYDFNVSVVAGNLSSDPATNYTHTDPEKRKLVLIMLCSSEKAFHCNKTETRNDLFEKLNNAFTDRFHDWVHWNLRWADRRP